MDTDKKYSRILIIGIGILSAIALLLIASLWADPVH